jgi:hypothetical protein
MFTVSICYISQNSQKLINNKLSECSICSVKQFTMIRDCNCSKNSYCFIFYSVFKQFNLFSKKLTNYKMYYSFYVNLEFL